MRSLIASLLVALSLLAGAAPTSSTRAAERRAATRTPSQQDAGPRLAPPRGALPVPPPAAPQPSFDVELSRYVTRYGVSRAARDRGHNVELAAQHLDGAIIAPGAELSFDAVVGPRTREAGFRDAPVLAGGEHHLGMGGGVCQVATTLHAAALYAGLAIVRQHVHSLPSVYIAPGLDARIADGTSDLVVRNTTAAPLLVRAHAEAGLVTVRLFGSAPAPHVTITSETEVLPMGETVVVDTSLPPGARIVDDPGHTGLRVRRTRTIDGRVEVRTFVYPAADVVVRVPA